MCVRHVEERGIDRVAVREVLGEVRRDVDGAFTCRLDTPQQRHAVSGKAAEVDGVSTIGARDDWMYPDRSTLLRRHLKQTQRIEAPCQIAPAGSARQPCEAAGQAVDPTTCTMPFLGH